MLQCSALGHLLWASPVHPVLYLVSGCIILCSKITPEIWFKYRESGAEADKEVELLNRQINFQIDFQQNFFSACSHWKDSQQNCKIHVRTFVNGNFCFREFREENSIVQWITEQEWPNSSRLVAKIPPEVWISRSFLIWLTEKYSTGTSMLVMIMFL